MLNSYGGIIEPMRNPQAPIPGWYLHTGALAGNTVFTVALAIARTDVLLQIGRLNLVFWVLGPSTSKRGVFAIRHEWDQGTVFSRSYSPRDLWLASEPVWVAVPRSLEG